MRSLFSVLFCALFLSLPGSVAAQSDPYSALADGFKNPPVQARPKVYWWWLNGQVDNRRLIEEIGEMKKAGIAGFDIFEIGVPPSDTMVAAGPAFFSDESLHSIQIAIEEAGRQQMEVGLNMASSWNAGGSWVNSRYAAKSIYRTEVRLSASNEASTGVKLPFPEIPKRDSKGSLKLIKYGADGKPEYYSEVAVVAYPDRKTGAIRPEEVIDVTAFFNAESEMLNWAKPKGDWVVQRFVCSVSGEQLKMPSQNSKGPIIDHFDAEATDFHFNYMLGRLEQVLGNLQQSALKSLYLASYEATGNVWTPSLPAKFTEVNDYELTSYLPALFDANLFDDQQTQQFLADFKRTLSELMISNFYREAKKIANAHGLEINSEAGGPGLPLHNVPVDPLKALGALDRPRGEFWINHNRLNADGIDILRVVKEVSAASHIYGRPVVEEEAFTTFQHWQEAPADMKPLADQAFCEGMNRVVVHGFTHNPEGSGLPGIVYHAGTHYNDKRVWWPMVRPFNDYLARLSYLFQQTEFCADVLYYYGDEIPNYGGHKNSRFTAGAGYDYEIVNTDVLLQATTEKGEILLPTGSKFKLLVLQDSPSMNPQVLQKLSDLVDKGAVVLGEKPMAIANLKGKSPTKSDYQLRDKLWDQSRKPSVLERSSRADLTDIYASIGLAPDFSYAGQSMGELDFIHYQKGDLAFYFIRNTSNQWVSKRCSFRNGTGTPELWNPLNGEIEPVTDYLVEAGKTTVPIDLAPFASSLVVFKPGNGAKSSDAKILSSNHSENIRRIEIEGAWQLFLTDTCEGTDWIVWPKLKSWTSSDVDSIKYYSGIATYRKVFQHDINSINIADGKIYLDLGKVEKIADVWLNGVHLGISWTAPYQFDISEVLKAGDNELIVKVANTWSNRLTGDALSGRQTTSTNIEATHVKGLNKIYIPWAEVPLLDSGLTSPVSLLFKEQIE
ncbi:glycosyl hydrolase [Mangrovibacterium diazotrophicum]|uniref:Glycosyl hydrolase family 2 n=1 Tax=Mangrovibacterium diazotrophicum TaxID=1261403 RepID=A0A419VYR3_9BACT|nr:glycosyl hydrolase [Mangrovibacterium diazotrophicum]RKD88304.1 glycosyl hydrolase family 2 [Mangrovibacterium diazotrophicum]